MAKAKSKIKIPVGAKNGVPDVPHWCDGDETYSDKRSSELLEELREGFPAFKAKWPHSTFNTVDQWLHWTNYQLEHYNFEWREPWEFNDTFKIVGYERGRSAAYFNLVSQTTGMTCTMFMTDASDLITSATLDKGVVSGRWIFTKRGANFGIKYLGTQTNEDENEQS